MPLSRKMKVVYRTIRHKLYISHNVGNDTVNKWMINNLIMSKNSRLFITFQEHMLFNRGEEYLSRYYPFKESFDRTLKLCKYYTNYLRIFCIPTFTMITLNSLLHSYAEKKAEAYYNKHIEKKEKTANCHITVDSNSYSEQPLNNLSTLFTKTIKENINENIITEQNLPADEKEGDVVSFCFNEKEIISDKFSKISDRKGEEVSLDNLLTSLETCQVKENGNAGRRNECSERYSYRVEKRKAKSPIRTPNIKEKPTGVNECHSAMKLRDAIGKIFTKFSSPMKILSKKTRNCQKQKVDNAQFVASTLGMNSNQKIQCRDTDCKDKKRIKENNGIKQLENINIIQSLINSSIKDKNSRNKKMFDRTRRDIGYSSPFSSCEMSYKCNVLPSPNFKKQTEDISPVPKYFLSRKPYAQSSSKEIATKKCSIEIIVGNTSTKSSRNKMQNVYSIRTRQNGKTEVHSKEKKPVEITKYTKHCTIFKEKSEIKKTIKGTYMNEINNINEKRKQNLNMNMEADFYWKCQMKNKVQVQGNSGMKSNCSIIDSKFKIKALNANAPKNISKSCKYLSTGIKLSEVKQQRVNKMSFRSQVYSALPGIRREMIFVKK